MYIRYNKNTGEILSVGNKYISVAVNGNTVPDVEYMQVSHMPGGRKQCRVNLDTLEVELINP